MDNPTDNSKLTLLRIKRKRNEEPLDGLVVDLPRKKQRDNLSDQRRGVFRYVHTIEGGASLEDSDAKTDLQNKIDLISERRSDEQPEPSRRLPGSELETPKQFNLVKSSGPRDDLAERVLSMNLRDERALVNDQQFLLYDGVSSSTLPTKNAVTDDDPEMARFNEMVRDYLSEHAPEIDLAQSNSRPIDHSELPEDDYVYDLFYYQTGPARLQTYTGHNLGSILIRPEDEVEFLSFSDDESDGQEDDADPDSNDEDNPANDYPDEESSGRSSNDLGWDAREYDQEDD